MTPYHNAYSFNHDEIMVRDMARHREDSKEFFSAAQEAHRSLDELMRSDIEAGQADAS